MTREEILELDTCYDRDDYAKQNPYYMKESVLKAMKEWGDQRFIEGRDKALKESTNLVDIGRAEVVLELKNHKDLQP